MISPDGFVMIVSQYGTSWSLPKGHVEGHESLIDTARREIYEESGVTDLELVADLGNYERFRLGEDGLEDLSEFKTIFMFLFRTQTVLLQPLDVENPEALWLPREKVAKMLTHPKDREFFLSVEERVSREK